MELFDVIEVEIAKPHKERFMQARLSEQDAEAYIRMAVMRRGVETSFYRAVPHTPPALEEK